MDEMIKVSGLYTHPLKSAAAISLQQAELVEFGLKNDRCWMLVDEAGNFLSQRQYPHMCMIKAVASAESLKLTIPGVKAVTVVANPERMLDVTVWGDRCQAYDCGDEVAALLSLFLKTNCRLVHFPNDEIRQVDLDYAKQGDKTAFSDGFPLLLISQASLDDINGRLKTPVTMTRFRPNIVVSGTAAYAEDHWKKIKIGGITMRVVKPCSRCSIPGVDPDSGERSVEVIKVLRDYRMRNKKVYFGQNVIADAVGKLEVGMTVEIIE